MQLENLLKYCLRDEEEPKVATRSHVHNGMVIHI